MTRLREPIAERPGAALVGAERVEADAFGVAVVVEPVKTFAALDVGGEIIGVAQRWLARQTEAVHFARRRRPVFWRGGAPVVAVEAAVAQRPVGQRQVIVVGDQVDVLGREQVGRDAAIDRWRRDAASRSRSTSPGNRRSGSCGWSMSRAKPAPSNMARTSAASWAQAGDEGIVPLRVTVGVGGSGGRPVRPAQDFEATQFRAEQEEIDAARDDAEVGVVQDEAAIGEVGRRAGIGDGEIGGVARELRWASRRRGIFERLALSSR